ncbi:hypothetical protein B7494_g1295 [Chlorociboria aeruginascens]|nr:hypothetical protein B7494_g1295 [Chlorociboria aeruginascens]
MVRVSRSSDIEAARTMSSDGESADERHRSSETPVSPHSYPKHTRFSFNTEAAGQSRFNPKHIPSSQHKYAKRHSGKRAVPDKQSSIYTRKIRTKAGCLAAELDAARGTTRGLDEKLRFASLCKSHGHPAGRTSSIKSPEFMTAAEESLKKNANPSRHQRTDGQQQEPLPGPSSKNSHLESDPEKEAAKFREFMERYDPRPQDLPELFPMSHHRAMMRTMYLDNILYSSARLHKHNWIALSENELYKELCGPSRWETIHDDLDRYTRSIQNYEYWLKSMIQTMDPPSAHFPPSFHYYGKALAILECARHYSNPSEAAILESLAQSLSTYHHNWSASNVYFRTLHERNIQKQKHVKSILIRVGVTLMGGFSIIIPMLVMVFADNLVVSLITTTICVFAVGSTLAWFMKKATRATIIAATASYAGVLMTFVGNMQHRDEKPRL